MKKIILTFLVTALCLGTISGYSSNVRAAENEEDQQETGVSFPLTVTDDLEREVTITEMPKRVAALTGSFADTWMLAGGEVAAAAHDAWEDFNLDLDENVLDIGSTMKVSLETLLSADPDLVLASSKTKSHLDLQATLESAKIPVLYFNVDGFDDYLRMLDICTQITGRPEMYEENGLAVEEEVEQIKEKALAAVEEQGAPEVLVLRIAAAGIHVKGSTGTVLGEMLKDLGCKNIADGSDLLEDLSLEIIIESDPDHIFIVQQGNDDEGAKKTLEESLTQNPAWSDLTAVKEGRVHWMDRHLYHFKPDKLWGTAYEQLEEILFEE